MLGTRVLPSRAPPVLATGASGEAWKFMRARRLLEEGSMSERGRCLLEA